MKSIEKLMLKETLLALVPTMIGLFVWISCVFLGVNYINTHFTDQAITPLMNIIWCISMLSLTKIIPQPYTCSIQQEVKEKGKK